MRGLGHGWTDLLVIAACTAAFVAVVGPNRLEPKGPPIALIAQDLGTTPEPFCHTADGVGTYRQPGHPPGEAQKQALAAALDMSVEPLRQP